MIKVEEIETIRRAHFIEGLSIREINRRFGHCRRTIAPHHHRELFSRAPMLLSLISTLPLQTLIPNVSQNLPSFFSDQLTLLRQDVLHQLDQLRLAIPILD